MTERRNEQTETTQVEAKAFELQIPPELNEVPQWRVQVAEKRWAEIYQLEISASPGGPAHKAYEFFVVDAKGRRDTRIYQIEGTFHSLHRLKYRLIEISEQLNVKRRTRKLVEVEESDDD